MQFPAIIGGVVPVVNLEGVAPGAIKLHRSGARRHLPRQDQEVERQGDRRPQSRRSSCPTDPITVVRRSDGSGTTFIWTDYLSKVSPEWKDKVGAEHGGGVAGRRRRQGQRRRRRVRAADQGLDRLRRVRVREEEQDDATRSVQNKDGQFVQPDDATFQAAAAYADWKNAPGFYQILTDQPGKTSWPITGASFILMHAKQDKPQNAAEVLKFFDWAFKNGQKMAEELDYVPMPDARRSR